jgi:hypothetical protein
MESEDSEEEEECTYESKHGVEQADEAYREEAEEDMGVGKLECNGGDITLSCWALFRLLLLLKNRLRPLMTLI